MDERISTPAEPSSLLLPSVALDESPRVHWGVLCYLAGDVTSEAAAIADNLRGLLAEGAGPGLAVAIQYDGPKGAERYLMLPGAGDGVPLVESLGFLNSGSTQTFCAFLRWGLSVLNAERIALVVRSRAADAFVQDAALTATPFAICLDEPAASCLDSAELGRAVRRVLREYEREQLDLLAGDVPHMQFLELAYEFEGRVHVLLSAQTVVPSGGWDYQQLLACWKEQCAVHPTQPTQALAQQLVPALMKSYRAATDASACALSALDLRRLDDLSRVFDTLCVNTIQVLGEGLIWRARQQLLQYFGDSSAEQRRHVSYDCGSFFVIYYVALTELEGRAARRWLASTLVQSGTQGLARFRQAMQRELQRSTVAGERRTELLELLSMQDPQAIAQHARALRDRVDSEVTQVIEALQRGQYEPARLAGECALDRTLAAAIERVSGALSEERRVDFDRLRGSKASALRLARHAAQAAVLLLGANAPSYLQAEAAASGEPGEPDAPDQPLQPLVIALATTQAPPEAAWPRWSGASLYRPPKLDDLMLSSYQCFRFHERVHWSALLGTANLIEDHPRALWRLVSSLLATGGPATRRDLMQRLTGADSVVWGLRDQFRAMASAPMLTLSLERTSSTSGIPREEYVLRLDSASGGAIVDEQRSRVQAASVDGALKALDKLLTSPLSAAEAEIQLRSIGGLLGEDVLQAMGARLDEEQRSALEQGSETVHLQLQIPGELMSYPWELLHHRGEWLSEKFAVGRQVFTTSGLARRVPRRRAGRVRALVIGDPLFDPGLCWPQLPAARAEAHQVAGAFTRMQRELGEVIDFDPAHDALIGVRVDRATFRERLRDGGYDIVHFAGHGQFVADDPEASAWLLSDGPLWALEIRNTLLEHPAPPWLVYGSACEAARESKQRYQGNVFGLASAFIHQGVAAYVAPLWPIEDLLAQQIALRFYHELLAERRSLGEALRRAKTVAHRAVLPSEASARERMLPVSLGWASLVLYGDPTEELFQALAGKDGQARAEHARVDVLQQPSAAPPARPKLVAELPPSAPLHAPDHLLVSWIGEPRSLRQMRGPADPSAAQLELVEEAGLLRFRVATPSADLRGVPRMQYADLPGSPLGAVLANEQLRSLLPARRGLVRVIGRWLLSGFHGGLTGLAAQYDREQVPVEGLVEIAEQGLLPLTSLPERDPNERALLIVHGTFSKTAAPVSGLGPEFLSWARKHYRVVLGFDHWTLSKQPDENARMLLEQLRTRAPQLARPGRLDVLAHSRGGLVARSMGELLDGADYIRNLVFLGTPNCGTDLANPRNWGAFANMLVNMTGLDHAELFGRLAGLLARLAVIAGETQLPGLLAQNPLMAAVPDSFLARLQAAASKRARTRYAAICASFEPSPLLPNLAAIWKTAKDLGLDDLADALFSQPNDLVVNTDYAWCLDQAASEGAKLPAFVEPERVLMFLPPDAVESVPDGVVRELATGVHHTNLFNQARAQQMIQQWLLDAPGFV